MFKYLSLILLFCTSIAIGSDVTLSWDAPTTNADGTPLTDLAGYHIYQREGSNTYNYTAPVATTTQTTVTLTNLQSGNYHWVARAYNTSGAESVDSNEVALVVVISPSPPLNLRITP